MNYNFPISPATASYVQNKQLPQAQNNSTQQTQATTLTTTAPAEQKSKNTTKNIAVGVAVTIAAVGSLVLLAKNGKLGDGPKTFIDKIINKFKPNTAADIKNAADDMPIEEAAKTLENAVGSATTGQAAGKTIADAEESAEEVSKSLKDIVFYATEGGKKDGVARLKDGSLYTGFVKDTLNNGKPISIDYRDGKVFQSIIGSEEDGTAIRKIYLGGPEHISVDTYKQRKGTTIGDQISHLTLRTDKDGAKNIISKKGARSVVETTFVPDAKSKGNTVSVIQLNTNESGVPDTLKLFDLKDNKVIKIKDEEAMKKKITEYTKYHSSKKPPFVFSLDDEKALQHAIAKAEENSLFNRLTGKASNVIDDDGTAFIKAEVLDGKVVISDAKPQCKVLADNLDQTITVYKKR